MCGCLRKPKEYPWLGILDGRKMAFPWGREACHAQASYGHACHTGHLQDKMIPNEILRRHMTEIAGEKQIMWAKSMAAAVKRLLADLGESKQYCLIANAAVAHVGIS